MASVGSPVLATPVAGVPVLLIGLSPAVTAVIEITPATVLKVAPTIASKPAQTGKLLIALAIGCLRAPATRNGAVAAVLLLETAKAEKRRAVPTRQRVEVLRTGIAAICAAPAAPARQPASLLGPPLAAPATGTVREEPRPKAASAATTHSALRVTPSTANARRGRNTTPSGKQRVPNLYRVLAVETIHQTKPAVLSTAAVLPSRSTNSSDTSLGSLHTLDATRSGSSFDSCGSNNADNYRHRWQGCEALGCSSS